MPLITTSSSNIIEDPIPPLDWKYHVRAYCDLWKENETSEIVDAAVKCVLFYATDDSDQRFLDKLKSMDDIVDILIKREMIGPNDLSLLRKMSIGAHCALKISKDVSIVWLMKAKEVIERYEDEIKDREKEKNVEELALCTCGRYHGTDHKFKASNPYKYVAVNIPPKDELDLKLLRLVFQRVRPRWLKVVRNLEELTENDISNARIPYRLKNKPEMEYLNCFREWKRLYPRVASVNNLTKALGKCDVYLDDIVKM